MLLLGIILSAQEISADPDKVKVIEERLEPKILTKAHSFRDLVFFYRRFVKRFSLITAPIIEYLKLGTFKWILLHIKPT